ncbi:6590_t:CDS:2, partial [Racocetra persica]
DTKVSLYQEICNIKNQLGKPKDSIQQLDPTLLKDPQIRLSWFYRELLVLEKLDECQYVENFLGISKMSRFMEPKLSNFHFAILHNETNMAINQLVDAINWMAPEKL